LGVELRELEDWNCCGATPYMSVSQDKSFALSARNLALAEPTGDDLVTGCTGCYLVLNKTNHYLAEDPAVRERIRIVLQAAGLSYGGGTRVRHLLDVVVNDVGLDAIAERVTRPLEGLRVAPYYGCQLVRPFAEFDDQEWPTSLDRLLATLGAEPVVYPVKTKCCGGMLMTTSSEAAETMVHRLLRSAERAGADCVATLCALCQANLEFYQDAVNRRFSASHRLPILLFTQLIGLALGLRSEELGLHQAIVEPQPVLQRLAA
jgi:heterodisulfide reductase subunit B